MRILITGLTGFIGHHVADYILHNTDWEIVGIDRIDATSTPHRLRYIEGWETLAKRVTFIWHDLRSPVNYFVYDAAGTVQHAVHLAASTHVDRSITDPLSFVFDNVVGTAHILEYWRDVYEHHRPDPMSFVQFGTDEIFGPAPEGVAYGEWDRYRSTNPYSACKAGAEELACAYSNTYRLPIMATHTMNVFGERQHHEKYVPNTIRKVLRGETVQIHANADRTKSGSRFYIHADNVARALCYLITHQVPSGPHPFDKWNIVGERELTNLELAEMIAAIVGKPLRYELVDFHSSRPGHDLRYALDGSKLEEAGFSYPSTLAQSLERTVKWYIDNPSWLGSDR